MASIPDSKHRIYWGIPQQLICTVNLHHRDWSLFPFVPVIAQFCGSSLIDTELLDSTLRWLTFKCVEELVL